jgi:adenosylcobinamide-phosphate synthase
MESRGARRSLGAAAGVLADLALGEPSIHPHPVAAFGSAMTQLEERTYADSRAAGVRYAATGLGMGLLAGATLRSTGMATYVAAAPKGLFDAAEAVGRALEADDLDAARELLPTLVGRDPSTLDADGMARAAIESVAENTVDAIVAPAMWGALLGAPGVLGHRALNTMDAMVGHHSPRHERFGWASARLDDGAAWVPARLTAALVAAVRPRRAEAVWRAVRDDAPLHPSPNAGVAEAAFAAALGLRLGGPLRYGDREEDRPLLGTGRDPHPADIRLATRLGRQVTFALCAALGVAALTRSTIDRRRSRP